MHPPSLVHFTAGTSDTMREAWDGALNDGKKKKKRSGGNLDWARVISRSSMLPNVNHFAHAYSIQHTIYNVQYMTCDIPNNESSQSERHSVTCTTAENDTRADRERNLLPSGRRSLRWLNHSLPLSWQALTMEKRPNIHMRLPSMRHFFNHERREWCYRTMSSVPKAKFKRCPLQSLGSI